MDAYINMIIMGIIQGITEFLPVSSSGHLAISHLILGAENVTETMMMEIFLHLATLIAIFIVYWKTLQSFAKRENFRMIGMLILAMIPTGIIGLIIQFTKLDERLVDSPLAIGIGFLVTGSLLWWGLRPRSTPNTTTMETMSPLQALWIGVVQGIAILPGISRSGSTISMGVAAGIKNEEAARFSFLVSILAVLSAVFLKCSLSAYKVWKGKLSTTEAFGNDDFGPLIVGFIVAMVVGYFALKFLIKLLHSGALRHFAYYCFLLAAITLGYAFFGPEHVDHDSATTKENKQEVIQPTLTISTDTPLIEMTEIPAERGQ